MANTDERHPGFLRSQAAGLEALAKLALIPSLKREMRAQAESLRAEADRLEAESAK